MSSLKIVEIESHMTTKELYPEFLRVYHKSVLSPNPPRWEEWRILKKTVKNIQDEDSFYAFLKVARHVHEATFFIAFLLKFLELKNPDLLPQAVEITVKKPLDIPIYARIIHSRFKRLPGEYLTQLMQDKFYQFKWSTTMFMAYHSTRDLEVEKWMKENFERSINQRVPEIILPNTEDREITRLLFEGQYLMAIKKAFEHARDGSLSSETISSFEDIFELSYHKANFEAPLLLLFVNYWALRKFAGSIYYQSQRNRKRKEYLERIYELSDIIGRLINMRIEAINETGLVKSMNSVILNVEPLPMPLKYDSKFKYYSDEVLAAIAVAVSQEPEKIRVISDKAYKPELSEKYKKILTEQSQLKYVTLFKSLISQMKSTRSENIGGKLKVDITEDTLVLSPELKTFGNFVSKVKFKAPAGLLTYIPFPTHQAVSNLYTGFSPKVINYLMHVLPHK